MPHQRERCQRAADAAGVQKLGFLQTIEETNLITNTLIFQHHRSINVKTTAPAHRIKA